jgi:F420H(2)-dependent quinone reductase
MPAVRRNRATELFWRLHRRLFAASGGRLGARALGMPTLKLTTIGRRSGERRENMLMYLDDDGTAVVFASNAGEPTDPAWWLNLKAKPEAMIMTRAGEHRVRAREAEGSERERLWSAVLAVNPDYGTYQRRAGDRRIPVVVLDPLD